MAPEAGKSMVVVVHEQLLIRFLLLGLWLSECHERHRVLQDFRFRDRAQLETLRPVSI